MRYEHKRALLAWDTAVEAYRQIPPVRLEVTNDFFSKQRCIAFAETCTEVEIRFAAIGANVVSPLGVAVGGRL